MKNKKREYSEKTRIALSKEKLSKSNNLVLPYLHKKGIVTPRNSPLQRATQAILYSKQKIEPLFFEQVKRVAQLIYDEYGIKVESRRLLNLINESRRLKGRPVYQAPDYYKEFKGVDNGSDFNQLSIDI